VIIDEVHAYDAYMSTLLEAVLSWLASLGSPAILLSATLPAGRRNRLHDAYRGGGTIGRSTWPGSGWRRISRMCARARNGRHLHGLRARRDSDESLEGRE
jgi:CRISPR-associated endonuclease/helicase Cas3